MSRFDDKAKSYQAWYETERGRQIDALEAECAFSLYQPQEGELVIDIGCGSGNFSRKLIAQGARLVGIDESSEMLRIARERDDMGLYQQMDMHELDYPDDYFDAAVSAFALEFTDRPEDVIREARRVVKPGGSYLFGTISAASDYGKYYIERGRHGEPLFAQASFHTLEEIKELFPDEIVGVGEGVCFGPSEEVRPDCPEGKVPGVFFIHWIKSMTETS